MMHYNANASVVYTDAQGNRFDTFVIFDTDGATGLTHINHENLKVSADKLVIHPKTVCKYHMPINDAFSFEMINKLRRKYKKIDSETKIAPAQFAKMYVLKKAS